MLKKLFFIAVLPVILFACAKKTDTVATDCNNTGVPDSTEIKVLQSYLKTNSITAMQDNRGFFYVISTPGSGATPTLSSTVTVQYTGKLFNGTTFDSNNSAAGLSFPLSQVITGWQLGVPLIKKGGSITLYLPPSLAYGCNGSGPIPPNAPLIFTINLLNVQ